MSQSQDHDASVVARWKKAERAFQEVSQFSCQVAEGRATADSSNWLLRRATLLKNAAEAAQEGNENLANEITAQAHNWSEIFEAWKPVLKYTAAPVLLIVIISEWLAHHRS